MLAACVLGAQQAEAGPKVFTEKDGLVVMEAESTTSSKGKWEKKKDVEGFTGDGHLEFTGNGKNGGPATSPLKYRFTVKEDGEYQLFIRARKRLEGEPGDKCNDGYVKLTGKFEAGDGNRDAPKEILKKDTKLYGGDADKWAWASKLDANHKKYNPRYKLKAGEKYTLTLSGRSIRWNVDRIVFQNMKTGDKAKMATAPEVLAL